MPRPPRAFVPGGTYHVGATGSDKQPIFRFDVERIEFLRRLAEVVEMFDLVCVSYCLMSTHYHLILQTQDGALSAALQRLNGGYSRWFNRVHGRSAHLLRNRFYAEEIVDETYVLNASRYIARNPVEAGVCREPGDWPWSSHRATAGLDPPPGFLDDSLIRDAFGGGRRWRERYCDFVSAAE